MKRIFAPIVLSAALLALAGLSVLADAPPTIAPIAVNPAYVTTSGGCWSYAGAYGYVWRPQMAEAEWSPLMDAPFDHGQWVFIPGWGYAWSPVIPPWSMSPLGWGYDSWYGGWYGFTPDGNWAGTITEYAPPYTCVPPGAGRPGAVAAPIGGMVVPWRRPFVLRPLRIEPIAIVPDPQPRGPRRLEPGGPGPDPHRRTEPARGGSTEPRHGRRGAGRVNPPPTHPQQPREFLPQMPSGGMGGGGMGGGGGRRHHR